MIHEVKLSARAEKDIQRVPFRIARKLKLWVVSVRKIGLERTRLIKGFHDEPLHGWRQHQRSMRLSLAYRAIYEIKGDEITFVEVQEVNKHVY